MLSGCSFVVMLETLLWLAKCTPHCMRLCTPSISFATIAGMHLVADAADCYYYSFSYCYGFETDTHAVGKMQRDGKAHHVNASVEH